MKRRDFLTNTALLGAGIPLGMSSAVMTSCTQQQSAGTAAKSYSPEELGMFSFVEVAPDGKPLKAALVGCGDRGTGAATQFLKSGPNVSIIALADLFQHIADGFKFAVFRVVFVCTFQFALIQFFCAFQNSFSI